MIHSLKKQAVSFRINLKLAQSLWGVLSNAAVKHLRELIKQHGLSIAAGDLQFLEGRWYVTHAGLLRIAQLRRCTGIITSVENNLSSASANRWVFKAIVYRGQRSRGFVGYGDADPSNVSLMVHGAEMRVAETRAVNRALRKAYGIGLCSVEELGSRFVSPSVAGRHAQSPEPQSHNGSNSGQPRLRDRLCLLIRQYNLDPTLVKAYAADFCGTETLSGASRDLVESFISQIAASAKQNRDSLVCKLNSYAQPVEVKQ